jgi:hypothetical protein
LGIGKNAIDKLGRKKSMVRRAVSQGEPGSCLYDKFSLGHRIGILELQGVILVEVRMIEGHYR